MAPRLTNVRGIALSVGERERERWYSRSAVWRADDFVRVRPPSPGTTVIKAVSPRGRVVLCGKMFLRVVVVRADTKMRCRIQM